MIAGVVILVPNAVEVDATDMIQDHLIEEVAMIVQESAIDHLTDIEGVALEEETTIVIDANDLNNLALHVYILMCV